MSNRKEKIVEILQGFHILKRGMLFHTMDFGEVPKITPAQYAVLMLVEGRGECSVKEVADALDITSSATTQLLDGLVENGYVTRDAHKKDRRAVVLKLSEKTKLQVKIVKSLMLKNSLKLFAVLNDKEFAQYAALSNKIVQRAILNNQKG